MRRLLIRPGAIGDVILSLPALLAADATEIWTPHATASLVRLAGIPAVRPISSTGLDSVGVRGGAEQCPALTEFDEIVSWYGSRNGAFRDAVSHLPFRFLDALPARDSGVAASDFFLRQISESAPPGDPRIAVDSQPGDYAVIHAFSGSQRKNWPLERFESVAAALPLPVRWTAGPDELLDRAIRFDNLVDLARLLAGARLFIGNDSGVTHLAAAVGTPTIAIFGPTDPLIWAPRGQHVRLVKPPSPSPVSKMEPEEVLRQARSLLVPR